MTDARESFTRALFRGTIDESILLPYPRLTEEEDARVTAFIAQVMEYLARALDREKVDEEEEVPPEVLAELARMGLFSISIPREYGGMGLSQSAYCRVFEAITGYDVGLGIILGVHLSIGTKGIVLAGTEEQKRRFLPKAATGEWFASFALTEPGAGSDAQGIESRAEPDGRGGWILNGEKIWIGNGSFSRTIVAFAQTPVERDGRTVDRVTAFILTPEMEGFERGEPLRKMGARGSNQTELRFRDVRVPAENVLGGVGEGFKLAMRILNSGRQGLSAGAAGGVKRCVRLAAEFAAERRQFGRPIAEFELIQGKIAAMAADAYTAESLAYLTTGLADRGDVDYALESAAAKVWCSEALDRAVDEVVQIAGGRGFVKGYPYERMYRDARITRIFEGTNEVLRLFVGLSGMEEPGEYLRRIGEALRHPIAGLGLLGEFAGGRVRLALGAGEPSIDVDLHPSLRRHFDYLTDHTRDLRIAVERVIRRHGRQVVERQFVVARIADMAIELYARAATLARTQAILEAHERGDQVAPPLTSSRVALDGESVARVLRVCDLACQRSGLRFRAARVALNDERDALLRSVAADVLAEIAADGPTREVTASVAAAVETGEEAAPGG